MGNFKDNPKEPFEVKVPEKIRKRIAMHEREVAWLKKTYFPPVTRIQDSIWSRFIDRIKKLLK